MRTALPGAVRGQVLANVHSGACTCAQVRRLNDAVERCTGGVGPARDGDRSEPPGKRSAQRAERERRREGYRPEGARPSSGLDRVARSRSDAPRHIVGSRAAVSVIGTIDCITVCTFVCTFVGTIIGARRTGVECGETVKRLAQSLVARRLCEVARRKSGGAAAERGTAGDRESIGPSRSLERRGSLMLARSGRRPATVFNQGSNYTAEPERSASGVDQPGLAVKCSRNRRQVRRNPRFQRKSTRQ